MKEYKIIHSIFDKEPKDDYLDLLSEQLNEYSNAGWEYKDSFVANGKWYVILFRHNIAVKTE